MQLHAQTLPTYYYNQLLNEAQLNKDNTLSSNSFNSHTSNWKEDSILNANRFDSLALTRKKWHSRLFNKNLLEVQDSSSKFFLHINPIFDIHNDKDLADSSGKPLSQNTRGLWIKGGIGNKFAFETMFSENQSYFPKYVNNWALGSKVAPGLGRYKTFKTGGYDYAMASGTFHYTFNKSLSVKAGHGKNKIGNGYRSMLWSDNSFNHPFLQFNFSFLKNKLNYYVQYGSLMNLKPVSVNKPAGSEDLFQKKPFVFYYATYNLARKIQIGIFQSAIWPAADSKNRLSTPLAYANPILGLNALDKYNLNTQTILSALNVHISLKSFQFYGQFAMQNNPKTFTTKQTISRKSAIQIGLKWYNIFGIKNLIGNLEHNQASPFMYANSNADVAYTNYNQNVAHPLGANFTENIGILTYNYKRFYIQTKLMLLTTGIDSTNFQSGNNPLIATPLYTSTSNPNPTVAKQLQGKRVDLMNAELQTGIILNQSYNLCLNIGLRYRNYQTKGIKDQNSQWIFVGVKSNLYNQYFDF